MYSLIAGLVPVPFVTRGVTDGAINATELGLFPVVCTISGSVNHISRFATKAYPNESERVRVGVSVDLGDDLAGAELVQN